MQPGSNPHPPIHEKTHYCRAIKTNRKTKNELQFELNVDVLLLYFILERGNENCNQHKNGH